MGRLRRIVLTAPFVLVLAGAAAACSVERDASSSAGDVHRTPAVRLEVSLGRGSGPCAPGTTKIARPGSQPIRLRITRSGGRARRALLVALHGAGAYAKGGLDAFRAAARSPDVVVVAPASHGLSWDPGRRSDVAIVERAIRIASQRCPIDPRRVAVGGFSAGATYALILGLSNGDLFHSVIALSPGALLPDARVGTPRVFVAHGRRDAVIPIADGGAAVVPALRRGGYDVTFLRFADGHEVTDAVSAAAVRWWLGRRRARS